MSKFIEKTLGSFNSVLNQASLFGSGHDKNSENKFLSFWTGESFSFTTRLKNAETKTEEEKIVAEFVAIAEKRIAQRDVSNSEVEKIVKICMVCERLGYPVQFIYVHAIKLAQKGNLQEKCTGYVAAASFLHPQHELVILLINTMQKDLCSTNYAEVLLSLTAICNLINTENIQNVIHLVEEKLNHKIPSVRKLAILTLGHCLQVADSTSMYQMALPKIEKALTDMELEVVSAAIIVLRNILLKVPGNYSYLIDSVIQLQEQILQRRVSHAMNYNDIPAPWLQISILRLLSFLCQNDPQNQSIIPILKKTLLQAEVNHTMAYAIIHEAIVTATHLSLDEEMSQLVLSSIGRFLRSKTSNLKLIGIEALVSVMQEIRPSIDATQQEVIMECLKHPDNTLQLKTLELLYQLANAKNVQAICKKIVEFMVQQRNEFSRKELGLKVLNLAKNYHTDGTWFVSTVNSVLLEIGDSLSIEDIQNILHIIQQDEDIKQIAIRAYADMANRNMKLSPCMIKILTLILSTTAEFVEFLPSLIRDANESSSLWFLVSLQEKLMQTREIPQNLVEALKDFPRKHFCISEVLDQTLCICEMIKNNSDFMCSNEEIDPSLSFLDDFVIRSLEAGASCYRPQSLRSAICSIETASSSPKVRSHSVASTQLSTAQFSRGSSLPKSPIYSPLCSPNISGPSSSSEADNNLNPKSKYVWTKEGRKLIEEPESPKKDEKVVKECLELFAGVS